MERRGQWPSLSFFLSWSPQLKNWDFLPSGLSPWHLPFFSVLSANPKMPLNQERTMLSPCPTESLGVTSLSALLLPAPIRSVNVSFMKRGHLISVSARLKSASSALSSWLAISNRQRKKTTKPAIRFQDNDARASFCLWVELDRTKGSHSARMTGLQPLSLSGLFPTVRCQWSLMVPPRLFYPD